MTHDYSEQMSLALDGRLTARERVALDAHLAVCDECRARWAAFQQIDRVLTKAAQVSPAPGFAARFAAKLARQAQVVTREEARRAARQSQAPDRRRIFAGIGAFAAGAVALALIGVPMLIAVWYGIGNLASLAESAPTLLSQWIEVAARWLVTLRALSEAGRATISVLAPSSGPILVGYALMLVVVTGAWVSTVRGMSRRRNVVTLPVLAWF